MTMRKDKGLILINIILSKFALFILIFIYKSHFDEDKSPQLPQEIEVSTWVMAISSGDKKLILYLIRKGQK